MRVEIRDTCYGDGSMKEVTFDGDHTVILPAPLAESIKIKIRCCCEFQYGLKMDGNLVSLFRAAEDRDYCRDMLEDVWPDVIWEEVTL